MTDFGLQLNVLNKKLVKHIGMTDSRLRQDVRAFENGDFKLA